MKPQNFSSKIQNFGSRKSVKDFLGNKKGLEMSKTIKVVTLAIRHAVI